MNLESSARRRKQLYRESSNVRGVCASGAVLAGVLPAGVVAPTTDRPGNRWIEEAGETLPCRT